VEGFLWVTLEDDQVARILRDWCREREETRGVDKKYYDTIMVEPASGSGADAEAYGNVEALNRVKDVLLGSAALLRR
jgi:hypothetical protein